MHCASRTTSWPRESQVREGDLTFCSKAGFGPYILGPLGCQGFFFSACWYQSGLIDSSQDSLHFYSGAKTWRQVLSTVGTLGSGLGLPVCVPGLYTLGHLSLR